MGNSAPRDTLGMTLDELVTYFDELLVAEAEEAATANKTSVDEELASAGFASVRASVSYVIQLISANNAFIARSLLDRGALPDQPAADSAPETGA